MFKLFGAFTMSMMMVFSVMAACPEKCNNSCGSDECAVSACGCPTPPAVLSPDVVVSENPGSKEGEKCTRINADTGIKATTDSGSGTDADVDVNKY